MNTDKLIDVLSTNVEPVDPHKVTWNVRMAIYGGLAVALVLGGLALGVRLDFQEPNAPLFLMLKLLFGAAIVVLGSILLIRHARPGGEFRSSTGLAIVPLLLAFALAALNLALAPRSHWEDMIFGDKWLECLISIPIIALLPFGVIMFAMRLAAPTNLLRTGALAGLVAGGISSIGYALHCTDDSLPFVAVWYGGTIVFCTIAGALLGPRLLRW
jgi:hypothetical protein